MRIISFLKGIAGRVLSIIASRVPTCNQVCFSSTPDFSDNAYAMYQCFIRHGLQERFRLVWLIYDKEREREIRKKISSCGTETNVVYKYSIRGIWVYVRSRYVFETHGLYPFLKLNQHPDKHICLWHGMPLKKLGASIGPVSSPNCDYTISTSAVFKDKMSQAFAKPEEKVLVSGQPRNDLFFEPSSFFKDIHFDKSRYRKVGAWLPTYRKSIFGELRNDGDYEDGKITFLSVPDLKRLDEELGRQESFLFIKIHLMDALQAYSFPGFQNIMIIKPSGFNYQLYPFLGSCDYLLTDYSSVFIDFDITGKPMGFVMDDIDEYRSTRGLYFDDLESVLPGPIIKDYDSLIKFIENPVRRPSSITLNEYNDDRSSERILEFLDVL